ncbi:ribosome recycling factor [Murdochiella vaginalis]|uniref:ribosome recycling factor n=1 Tax=Murdochiella vaginalis TaxID=1852373 RepID=UPI0008FE5276|nr:ribosome recycling factor [Murdochiella vaginalis]
MYQQSEYKKDMEKAVLAFREDLSKIRAGRANPRILDDITFEYFGTPTPIAHAATITVPEARMITIQPWDAKNIPLIEKAILASDIGITPSNDGKLIRLPFPPLTEERRKDLVKDMNKRLELARVSVRNIRREGMEAIAKAEKEKEFSEDERHTEEQDLQKLTDQFIKELDGIGKEKEKELMEI